MSEEIIYMCIGKNDYIPVVLTRNINEAKYFEKGFSYRIVSLKKSDYLFLRDALNTLTQGEKQE